MKAKRDTSQPDKEWYLIDCPGCGHLHSIAVNPPFGNGAKWTFNGDLEYPTFSPSLLVRTGKHADPNLESHIKDWPQDEKDAYIKHSTICHSFIRDGNIEFLSDSTHQYAGRTMPLTDFDPAPQTPPKD